MSPRVISKATVLANKYKQYKKEWYKVKVRNELYMLVKPFLCIWINAILQRWHFQRSEGDIISYSFPALLFGLEYWKPDSSYNFPGHFYTHTRYYLLHELAKETSVHVELNELRETLTLIPNEMNLTFSALLTLVEIKNCLPDFAKPAFDDAVSTTVYSKSLRNTNRKIDGTLYTKLKSSFTAIVEYFVRKNLC